MHIGFDAKRYFHNATGLGNYARTTIHALAHFYPQHVYTLFDANPCAINCAEIPINSLNLQKACPPFHHVPALWRSYGIPKTSAGRNVNIYHGLSHELPFLTFGKQTKTVLTIHDLLFLTHPHLYRRVDRLIYTQKYLASCRRADRIIALSNQTALDLKNYCPECQNRIRVVYQSCDPRFWTPSSPTKLANVHKLYKLPQEFLLFVGSLIPRKGCHTLIKAGQHLGASCPPLVIVGTGREKQKLQEDAQRFRLPASFLGRVDAMHLPALYQAAALFIYPSEAEGFGIPIIEALCSGTPVITSTGSCFAEPGGEAACYTPPGDSEALAALIKEILENTEKQQQMRKQGLRHVERFRPQNTAKSLMDLYLELFHDS